MTYNVRDKRYGLTEEEIAAELAKFQKRFPGKRLLALHLDGFSHHVIYDGGTKDSEIRSVEVSFYMSEAEEMSCAKGDEAKAEQSAARAFLRDIGHDAHACYQGSAVEITYVEPHER